MPGASVGTIMREPSFWWHDCASIGATALAPFATLYGTIAAWRLRQDGQGAGIPVVCVGNPTVGGAGKTPVALAVARLLLAAGEKPVFLSRGYGGRRAGPSRVESAPHAAGDVGDEPVLLARVAPTIVARDRVAGAKAATALGASVLVMDDGFQNPSLRKNFSLLVVDARRGIGNGRVIPAGPLRAPLAAQLERTQALVVVGSGAVPVVAGAEARRIPVFRARLVPDATFISALGGGRVLAFAGIGDPEKFFATLRDAGVAVAATRSFADHHRYRRAEMRALCAQADREGLVLVTTEKDLVRLEGDLAATELAARAHALPVVLAFDDEAGFSRLLQERLAAARRIGN
jgi:tetraacyldisaccharide 4'-kinase